MLRYRTDEMPIREMTYLFILIALPVMNSVMMSNTSVPYLLVANGAILVLLFALEKEWGFRFSGSKRVIYDRVDLLGPADEARLLADLSERTGLNVARVDVRRIDFLHDTADMVIYYEPPRAPKAVAAPGLFRQGAQSQL